MKTAVLMGGISSERDISLITGTAVLESLKRNNINAEAFDTKYRSILDLKSYTSAFIALHGKHGEDGIVQSICEYLSIPYTCSGPLASGIAMDKNKTKILFDSVNIPTPKWQCFDIKKYSFDEILETVKLMKFPLIVKPNFGGSTIGLTKVNHLDMLKDAIVKASLESNRILIEEYISGEEITITIDEKRIYPCVKIVAPENSYDYHNKYFSDETQYICPFILDEAIYNNISHHARNAYNVISASGIVRIDLILSDLPYFLEINTIPGMTPHSLTPLAFKAAGYSFDELCLYILQNAGLDK